MNNRDLSGIIITIIGVFLLIFDFFVESVSLQHTFLIYGIALIIIGIVIFINKKEDVIEEVKKN